MARRMLIDASHPEETRVVVVDGTRLEEFDFETASRKPLKGNIYLAKVIRIEPSLQAAFVEYGGNRHGFLAFSEIHPDYYQIPVADRERLIAEQQRLHDAEDEEPRRRNRIDRTDIEEVREENFAELGAVVDEAPMVPPADSDPEPTGGASDERADHGEDAPAAEAAEPKTQAAAIPSERLDGPSEDAPAAQAAPDVTVATDAAPAGDEAPQTVAAAPAEAAPEGSPEADAEIDAEIGARGEALTETTVETTAEAPAQPADPSEAPQPDVSVETLGGDDVIEQRETRERRRRNPIRQYKIQEVIKRRQILLVQVVKEERGNKGAALTTYLSLAGRYCVLMPNAGRGGGISRKISNPADRKRMKEVLGELDVPQGMGVILRTAGLERSTIDIKRDYEYLSRLWDSIRDITMRSTAPALIYEEGDLIKRSLRDVYDTDIAQVLVEGEAGFQAASEFMRQLVPHQANKVEAYKDPIPLFHRYQVESQFDAMHSPVVQLRSGGYIVINPTEALVAIDVNSGRSTKERNIEETALRTNLEAAEEVARQVRLRDLAGLIVIDFIDMEETRHQRQVEHKVKDAMRHDRARIQIGRISAFGLLEMSRQRLRPSLLEHSTEICPHCAGTGRVRSIESAALHALRAIEEEGVRRRASEIVVSVPPNVALYLLNQKRHTLSEVEKRYGFTVTVEADDELHAADCEIERVRTRRDDRDRPAQETARASYEEVSDDAPAEAEGGDEREAGEERSEQDDGTGEGGRRPRRRRRRRRGRRDDETDGERPQSLDADEDRHEPMENGHDRNGESHRDDPARDQQAGDDDARDERPRGDEAATDASADGERDDRDGDRSEADGDRGGRRRRGRRGGRRRRRENGDGDQAEAAGGAEGGAENDRDGGHDRGHDEGHDGGHEIGRDEPREDRERPQAAAVAEVPVSPALPIESTPAATETAEAVAPAPSAPATSAPLVAPAPPVVAAAPQPVPAPEPEPAAPVVPSISAPPEKPKRGWWSR